MILVAVVFLELRLSIWYYNTHVTTETVLSHLLKINYKLPFLQMLLLEHLELSHFWYQFLIIFQMKFLAQYANQIIHFLVKSIFRLGLMRGSTSLSKNAGATLKVIWNKTCLYLRNTFILHQFSLQNLNLVLQVSEMVLEKLILVFPLFLKSIHDPFILVLETLDLVPKFFLLFSFLFLVILKF